MNNKNRTQGFTLIELLIVIAIIGILAAVLIPNLLGAQKRAYDTGAASCAKSIQTAEATSQVDTQSYFNVTKAAASAVAPTIAAGSGTAPVAGSVNLATNCSVKEMAIATTGTTSGTLYTITVADSRGAKTYTATPSDLTNVVNAAATP